ncbi:alpha/beta hydrolase [Demetria terragena]|uniref:alpha/beta hydrolase n=1 Tax=Demetria terragena TaxID=63959 RepID=UPI000379A04B|nr:alpha/beta hydrolase [Demetria terragena]
MATRHSRTATLAALTLVAGVAVSGCQDTGSPTVAPTSSPAQKPIADLTKYAKQSVTWSEETCPESMRSITLISDETTCAKVTAPKDYTDHGKGDISLMVARTKGKDANSRVLFTNPGGPGGPAARFSAAVAKLSPLSATHDVIGIDPRGTGDSTSVSCEPAKVDYDDPRTLGPAQIRQIQTATKKSVQACAKKHGDLLPHITSDNTARDHDLVRQILGKDTVDYYGVSGGTWLGARYATLFPKRVGRFVLDSNTDFSAEWSKTFFNQPMAFQRRWDSQFLPWAARHNDRYSLGATPQAVDQTYEKIRKAAGDGRLGEFTPVIIDSILASALYSDSGFTSSASLLVLLNRAADGDKAALSSAERGAGSGGGGYEDYRERTTFTAITCNDTPWSKQASTYAANALSQGKKYPLTGYNGLTNECAFWPYEAPQTKVDLSKAPPMMMVQTELDPATSYENAIAAHKASPSTRMLVVDNQGDHGAVVGSKNACVTTAAYDFLIKGDLIGDDGVCPSIPLPNDRTAYEVGEKQDGEKLPTTDGYARQQPNLAQQVIDLLLKIIAEATRPRN